MIVLRNVEEEEGYFEIIEVVGYFETIEDAFNYFPTEELYQKLKNRGYSSLKAYIILRKLLKTKDIKYFNSIFQNDMQLVIRQK